MKTIRITMAVALAGTIAGMALAQDTHTGEQLLSGTDFQKEISATVNPTKINMNTCPDNGVVNVTVSNQSGSGFDVLLIAGVNPGSPDGVTDAGDAPHLTPFNADTGFNDPRTSSTVDSTPIDKATFSDTDGDGVYDTATFFFKTCLPVGGVGLGLSQIIQANPDDMIVYVHNQPTVDLALTGMTAGTGGQAFAAFDFDHKINKLF